MMSNDLLSSIDDQDLEEVRRLVQQGADVNQTHRAGRTPLHYAVLGFDQPPNEEIVKLLLDSGADVNAQDDQKWSALHFAARDQRVGLAKLLLDAGANVNCVDAIGKTPLFNAVFGMSDSFETIQLLLSHGADPSKENKAGVSPLRLAETRGDDQLIALLA